MSHHRYANNTGGGGSRGAYPAMAPPSKLAMEFGPPLGGWESNDSIVNLSKCKDFGSHPVSMSATDLTPLRKNSTLKY